jgi:hypothetical protein
MLGRAVAVGEEPGGLDDDLGSQFLPRELRGVLLAQDLNRLAVEADLVARVLDLAGERAESRVVLRQMGEGRGVGDVVDRDEVDVEAALPGGPEQVAPDAAEAVDTDRYGNGDPPPWEGTCKSAPGLSARAVSNLSARAQERSSRRGGGHDALGLPSG